MTNVISLEEVVQNKIVVCVLSRDERMLTELCNSGASGVLVLANEAGEISLSSKISTAPFNRLKDVTTNNGHTLILHGRSMFALYKKKYFWGSNVETILVPEGMLRFLMSPFIKRYGSHHLLNFLGKTTIPSSSGLKEYSVFSVPKRSANNRKVYAPPHMTGVDVLRSLKGIDHILLRAFSRIEQGGAYKDLDILIDANEAPKLIERFSNQVGTKAIDVYTVDGTGGYDYQSVPYILPRLAQDALDSAYRRPSGIWAPSTKYAYLTFVFHLLFHGKSRKISPDASKIVTGMFSDKHWSDLQELCVEGNIPLPTTLEEMEEALRVESYFPGRDLLAFYGKNNEFVRQRYLEKDRAEAGLSTFFVRSFPEIPNQISEVRNVLMSEMEIVLEGELNEAQQHSVMQKVRGGNWYDRTLNADAPPVYWFVCYDKEPSPPKGKLKARYPDLDNEKNARLKLELRKRLTDRRGLPVRYIHASDNSDEAMEHLEALDLQNAMELQTVLRSISGVGKQS